jgi:HlyD family secretion protein
MKKSVRLWLLIGGVVALGAFGFYLLNGSGEGDVDYRMEAVDRGPLVLSISATGTLNALTTVQVGSQVSGTIARLYADFNSVVKEGQLLAQLDPTFLAAAVSEQRANMERATAQVHEAERTYARTRDLFAKSLVSQAELDAAQTTMESAAATLRQTQASLERAEVNLRYATIRAPISGVVISRDVDVGQTVAASLQAPTLFTIANDLRKMQVEASVDEADIGTVKVGQRVTFRVDAYPEEEFQGMVSQIRLAPVITQNVVTYTVIIDAQNAEGKLMPGMTATVSIVVAQRGDVLRVPVGALRFVPPDGAAAAPERVERTARREGGQRQDGEGRGRMKERGGAGKRVENDRPGRPELVPATLWVLRDGKPSAVKVRRGIQNTRHAEILSDELKEGDLVIVGSTGGAQQGPAASTNPFMPQMPRGGGRRGGF